MKQHEFYMQRCLELAENGIGKVSPNPLVGCVIVFNKQIVGEGYHCMYGKAHAEVNAINSVKEKDFLQKSTLYVNLEPCSHYGKTPPCTDLIIKNKIPKVVIANKDPFAKVNGSGIKKLQDAGIEVISGVLGKEAEELNRRFFCFHKKIRPYITLKWAQTADGYMDIDRKTNPAGKYWISSEPTNILVHKWRTEEDAILVGTNTVRNDNPSLTVRLLHGRNPLRIILDRKLSLDQNFSVFNSDANSLIINDIENSREENIEFSKIDFNAALFGNIFKLLYEKDIQSVLVEGGKNVLEQLISNRLWDEARIIHSPINFRNGLKAPDIKGEIIQRDLIGNDLVIQLRNRENQ